MVTAAAAVPMTKAERANQRNAVLAGFLGWTLDAFDFFILTLVIDDIAKSYGRSRPDIAFTLTVALAMRPLGAIIFGIMADRLGRRLPLMINVVFYAIVSVLSGLAPSYQVFLLLRMLFGVGMGGEWGVGASLALESASPRLRGLLSGLLQEGYALGSLLAALCPGASLRTSVPLSWDTRLMRPIVRGRTTGTCLRGPNSTPAGATRARRTSGEIFPSRDRANTTASGSMASGASAMRSMAFRSRRSPTTRLLVPASTAISRTGWSGSCRPTSSTIASSASCVCGFPEGCVVNGTTRSFTVPIGVSLGYDRQIAPVSGTGTPLVGRQVELSRSYNVLQLGDSLQLRLGSPRVVISQDLTVYPQLGSASVSATAGVGNRRPISGNLRADFSSTITLQLSSWLGWQVGVQDTYNRQPYYGVKPNDLTISSGLTFVVGRPGTSAYGGGSSIIGR